MFERLVRRREEDGGAGRLVLAFDAGCMTCSELARRIRERVGDRLELRSLGSPEVREWRRRALGEEAPWAPTLVEVRGLTRIRAWTGPGMAVHLGRALGPVASWRVMQILGEFGSAAASERWGEHPIGTLARAVSRGQFLKGAGGAVAGAAVLAGFGWIPLAINRGSTAQAQTQEPIQGCGSREPTYSYKEIKGAERDSYVNNNFYHNAQFNILWQQFQAYGYKPRPDKARVVTVTYTTSGGITRIAYDLRVPFERVGQQYPVLSVTANTSVANTSMAVFQRVSETDEASRVDIYRADRQRRSNGSFYWRVVYTRSWQGPFPLVDAPTAQEVTPSSSELLAPEGTTSEVSPVSSPEVAASEEVTASEATTTLSADRNPCEDCGKFVEAVSEYTCYGVAEIGCGLVCFEPGQYVDLDSCQPQCGATIAAVCAAGVPADEGTACSPFCDYVELTGDELVSVAREKALTDDVRRVSAASEGPGSAWPVGIQTGEVFERCSSGTDEDDCTTLICHDPLGGDCASSDYNEYGAVEVGESATAVRAARRKCADGKVVLWVSYQLSDGRVIGYSEWEDATDESYSKTKAQLYKFEDGKMRSKRRSANGQEPTTPLSSGASTRRDGTASNAVAQYEDDPCGGCCVNAKKQDYSCDAAVSNLGECALEQCGGLIPCVGLSTVPNPVTAAYIAATAGCLALLYNCSDVNYDCCSSGANECFNCNFSC